MRNGELRAVTESSSRRQHSLDDFRACDQLQDWHRVSETFQTQTRNYADILVRARFRQTELVKFVFDICHFHPIGCVIRFVHLSHAQMEGGAYDTPLSSLLPICSSTSWYLLSTIFRTNKMLQLEKKCTLQCSMGISSDKFLTRKWLFLGHHSTQGSG